MTDSPKQGKGNDDNDGTPPEAPAVAVNADGEVVYDASAIQVLEGLEAVRSDVARHLPGLEAGRAHVEALGGAVHEGAHALDVGVETTLGDLARPGTVVSEARLLGADVADGSHRALLVLLERFKTDDEGPRRATGTDYPTPGGRVKS